jgi:hypothetical protein
MIYTKFGKKKEDSTEKQKSGEATATSEQDENTTASSFETQKKSLPSSLIDKVAYRLYMHLNYTYLDKKIPYPTSHNPTSSIPFQTPPTPGSLGNPPNVSKRDNG